MERFNPDELMAKAQTTASRRDVVKRLGALGLGGLAFTAAGLATTASADDDGGRGGRDDDGGRGNKRRRRRRKGNRNRRDDD